MTTASDQAAPPPGAAPDVSGLGPSRVPRVAALAGAVVLVLAAVVAVLAIGPSRILARMVVARSEVEECARVRDAAAAVYDGRPIAEALEAVIAEVGADRIVGLSISRTGEQGVGESLLDLRRSMATTGEVMTWDDVIEVGTLTVTASGDGDGRLTIYGADALDAAALEALVAGPLAAIAIGPAKTGENVTIELAPARVGTVAVTYRWRAPGEPGTSIEMAIARR